ncbi:metal ABC transporter ATP-binding protein [Fluviicola taffensis]|uniref:Phosphonate-transporting ATPase n=1 Tax=Fluviicola taffensis (strain DSM 16823 / NCIMB 13979 / RW262) TaxID=755732 RepID=F2IDU2_FLUTR|nr:metal ABC transporter ATP-binding protein [Fluviicola taffensis]AEA44484.1 Phosphonate-transporting ATPase [Fluviicola taffensis DSM 16823]
MKKAIEIKGLTISYKEMLALDNISVSIESGKITGIIGPNGSGKSTMLKGILGIVPISSGEVSFFGNTLEKYRSKIAYVPQRESIDWDFPITVEEVVAMGRIQPKKWWARTTSLDKQIVKETLKKVQLSEFGTRQIGQLSGGQQQRVFLARALAQEAELIVMDEPFVGIDMASQDAILAIVQKLRDAGKTIVIVHHDLSVVAQYFDDVVLLNKKLIAHGPIDSILKAENIEKAYGMTFLLNRK